MSKTLGQILNDLNIEAGTATTIGCTTIDWQQVHIQFVGQIASAIISNYEIYAQGIAEECKRSGKSRPEMIAQMSIEIANALIEELKKGQDGRNNL